MTYLPAEHHASGLRVSARREIESRAVDDAQSVHTHHAIGGVHDSAHHSTAMVMPDGANGVPAPLMDGSGIGRIVVGEAKRIRPVENGLQRTQRIWNSFIVVEKFRKAS